MYENDEFERSLRPIGIAPEPQIFVPDDSDMMDVIFQYLETDGEAKMVKSDTRHDFDPRTVASMQRYGQHEASSQESSPSPTGSLFSQSHNVSQTSGLTTPRTLSNDSLRSRSSKWTGQAGFRVPPNITSNLLAVEEVDQRPLPPPKIPSHQFSSRMGAQYERPQSPLQYPTTSNSRNVELVIPQEKRKTSYGGLLASISERYERRSEKDTPYRHSVQPAFEVRSKEVEESSQVMPPTYTPYVPGQKVQAPYASMQWPSQQVPDHSRAPYETKTSQYSFKTYINNLSSSSSRNSLNVENTSPPTFQGSQLLSKDLSPRRYDSFRSSLSKIGRYEPKNSNDNLALERKVFSLDTPISPKPSVRSRFSFSKSLRASIANSLPNVSSPSSLKHLELVSHPAPMHISAPLFNTPPRHAPRQPLPPLLSVGYREPPPSLPEPIGYGTLNRSVSARRPAPILRIQIPESTRPIPVKVEDTLTNAYEKFKEVNLSRPVPAKPKSIGMPDSPTLPPSRPLPPLPLQLRNTTSLKQYQLEDIPINVNTETQMDAFRMQARTPVLPEKSTSRHQLSPLAPRSSTRRGELPSSQPSALSLIKTSFLTPASNSNLSILLSRHPSQNSTLTWSITSTLKSPSHLLSITTYPHSRNRESVFCTAAVAGLERGLIKGDGERLFRLRRKWGSTRVAETVEGEEVFTVRDIGFEGLLLFVVEFSASFSAMLGVGEVVEGRAKEKERWILKGEQGNSSVEIVSDGILVGRIGAVGRNGGPSKAGADSEDVKEGRGWDYTIDAQPGSNYAVLVALVTVFDDWRMDCFI